jgi:hypothetical protein
MQTNVTAQVQQSSIMGAQLDLIENSHQKFSRCSAQHIVTDALKVITFPLQGLPANREINNLGFIICFYFQRALIVTIKQSFIIYNHDGTLYILYKNYFTQTYSPPLHAGNS